MDYLSDAQLVNRALQRRGDASQAFALLYGRYQSKVAAYIGARVNYNTALMEDVLQDTFTRAWQKLEQLQEADKFFPWLVTIARNTALDSLRDKKRVNDLATILKVEEEDLHEAPDLGETEKLLATLDPSDREIVVLKIILEYSFDEIAIKLSVSVSATKMRYYRALDKLKHQLNRES